MEEFVKLEAKAVRKLKAVSIFLSKLDVHISTDRMSLSSRNRMNLLWQNFYPSKVLWMTKFSKKS
jgi:hypothetical protein